ncbi:MAG TPA: PAS domain-containing sensor histidine kinase [Thermoanaerobaculia bacterium]
MDETLENGRKHRKRPSVATPIENEPEQTIDAIRRGEVDAFVVQEDGEDKIFVLKPGDPPYRLIVEGMRQGAATLTTDAQLVYSNQALARLLGSDRSALAGQPFRKFITTGTNDAFTHFIREVHGVGSAQAEVELIAPDGIVPVLLTASLLSVPGEARFAVIVTDMREERAKQEMLRAKEAAEESSRAKDLFLALVSHELRTPITAILGWTDLLRLNRPVDESSLDTAVTNIRAGTLTVVKLVDDLLDVSRMAMGRLSLETSDVELGEIVASALETVRFNVGEKRVELIAVPCPEPLRVRGDAGRLRQVVLNLLDNAVKFTSNGGHIHVELSRNDRNARLVVADDGEGIEASFLPFVFESFRQGDVSETRVYHGLGLGLAIVRQLIEAHGGEVEAQSAGKNKGAAFIVTLPLI